MLVRTIWSGVNVWAASHKTQGAVICCQTVLELAGGAYGWDGRGQQGLSKDQAVGEPQRGLAKGRHDGVCDAVAQARLDEASREPVGDSDEPSARRSPLSGCRDTGVLEVSRLDCGAHGISLAKALNA